MPENPSAFPARDFIGQSSTQGMTMRDYFAACAMQGYLATFVEHSHPAAVGSCEHIAAYSYVVADAMLAEREKGTAHA